MSIFKESFQPFVFNQLTIREAILDQKSNRLLGAPTVKDLKLESIDFPTETTLPAGSFYTNTTSRQCVIRMSSGANLKVENNLLDVNNKDASNLVTLNPDILRASIRVFNVVNKAL